ncbi:hypothetical protein [Rhabdothermincola salaria]|uniref:hypothetical protein n=1 Tax=Rhabdothermincola salaria TaxID=2903142 RepID=UPI001E328F64|nr:hypothetical protein [Rhabdothermincola salaria]MCD9623588.1 hypothetical protein [Rhabdothermincola salaria]
MAVPAELREIADRAAPVTLARHQTLPVVEALAPLLPEGAVARGSVVGVAGGAGATSLALTLVAGPSRDGSWAAVVGLPELGLAAAAELGVALDRLALVALPRHDPATWAPTVAALIGAVDLVLVDARLRLAARDTRRLAARARERGSVLVPVAPGALVSGGAGGTGGARPPSRRMLGEWACDVILGVTEVRWEGLGQGHGHLRRRQVVVTADGRGRAARPRRGEVWLPADGTTERLQPSAPSRLRVVS